MTRISMVFIASRSKLGMTYHVARNARTFHTWKSLRCTRQAYIALFYAGVKFLPHWGKVPEPSQAQLHTECITPKTTVLKGLMTCWSEIKYFEWEWPNIVLSMYSLVYLLFMKVVQLPALLRYFPAIYQPSPIILFAQTIVSLPGMLPVWLSTIPGPSSLFTSYGRDGQPFVSVSNYPGEA